MNTAMYWLLDVEAYDFDLKMIKGVDLTGMALIASRQLWSVIRGETVLSILIGPGVFKGVAEKGPTRIEVLEHISALLFNPSDLRYEEPLPLVDIVNPEVIDPMAVAKTEEIHSMISKLMIERGNVLVADPLLKMKFDGSIPQVAHYDERIQTIQISHVSGLQRARFILGGTHGPVYQPFAEYYQKRRYQNPQYTKIMAVSHSCFSPYQNNEITREWIIVEKFGMSDATGLAAITEEYETVLSIIHKNEDFFIYE